jgi:nicotinate-nucleotide adenylyltransferase
MTGVACQGNPLLEVSDVEIRLGGPSYTVNTLELFKGFSDYETFFILGTDSLKDISSWKDYRRLFELCDFIVVERPGIGFDVAWAAVPPALRARFRRDGRRMIHSSSKALIRSDVVGLNISSTTIRALLSAGRSIRYLVSEPVRTYIIENHLYGC